MKKLKIAFWVIIVIILFIFGYHNSEFFMTKQTLILKYGFGEYTTPELPIVLYWVLFLALAAGVWFLYTLPRRLKMKKEVQQMHDNEIAHLKEIAALRRRIDAYQSQAAAAEEEAKARQEEASAETAATAPVSEDAPVDERPKEPKAEVN